MAESKYIQGVKYKLAGSGITATATTIILQSFKLPDGTNITTDMIGGTSYMTLEPGSDGKIESISFTTVTQNADGTATLTGVIRGLQFVFPYTQDTDLRKAHAGGTIAILSNSAAFYNEFVSKDAPEADSSYTPSSGQDLTTYDFVTTREGYWTGAVADFASLPIGAVEGEARVTLDTGKIYVWDIAETTTATIASADTATNIVTFTGNHGLETGDYCYFYGTLPGGLSLLTPYYVYKDSATELHFSASKAGATVDITSDVAGGTIKETEWVLAGAGGGAGTVYVENFLGTDADDAPTNTIFTLTSGSWTNTNYLQVYVNGVLQEQGATADYQASDDTNTMTFNAGVEDTDKVTLLVVSVDLYNPAWGIVTDDIVPDTTDTHDIGSDTKRFKDGYFEGDVDIDGNVDVEGTLTAGVGTMPTGTILPYAGSSAPTGYLLCDDSAVSRATYSALFAVIGTNYGVGDGSTTFNVPDLRGNVPVGKDAGTFSTLGSTGGEETHSLSIAEMPAHTHPGEYVIVGSGSTPTGAAGESSGTGTVTTAVPTQGSGTAHNNLQPYQVVNYIIKT